MRDDVVLSVFRKLSWSARALLNTSGIRERYHRVEKSARELKKYNPPAP